MKVELILMPSKGDHTREIKSFETSKINIFQKLMPVILLGMNTSLNLLITLNDLGLTKPKNSFSHQCRTFPLQYNYSNRE